MVEDSVLRFLRLNGRKNSFSFGLVREVKLPNLISAETRLPLRDLSSLAV